MIIRLLKSSFMILAVPLLPLLLVSCGGVTAIPATEITDLSSTPTPKQTREVFLSPTVIVHPSSTQNGIQYDCIDVQDKVPLLPPINGTIVLLNDRSESLLFLDLNSGEEQNLPVGRTRIFSAPPNGMYLAYDSWVDTRSRVLKIIDSGGNLSVTIDMPEDWYGFEWLSNATLLINYPVMDYPFILLSPFDREQKILDAYFRENSYMFADTELIHYWGFYAYHKNVYDPNLTRALYPSYDEINYDGPIVVIRDLISSKDLAAFATNVGWGVSPKWSPDGEKIAIGLNTNPSARINGDNEYEILVIERDGSILLSTELGSFSEYVFTSYLSWSPDSRYVAFRYTTSKDINEKLRLAVLDTLTKKVTDYCITSDIQDLSFVRGDPAPIWSPDSDFLLIETVEPEIQERNVIIVDIKSGQPYLIGTGFVPVGWMK